MKNSNKFQNDKNIKFLKTKFKKNLVSVGSWMQLPSPDIAEIFSNGDFDWITLDLEHGSFNNETIVTIIRSIEQGGKIPFIRLSKGTEENCKNALEAGASGIIIPMIKNNDELKKIISYCFFPPKGTRGVGYSRVNLFGKKFNEYKKKSNNLIIVPIIETKEAYEDLDNILKNKDVDAVFIGPYDLCASLGINFKDKKYNKIINDILLRAKKHNKACGIHVVQPSLSELNQRIKQGFIFIAYSIDAVFFYNAINKK